jgi:hypothetical protein
MIFAAWPKAGVIRQIRDSALKYPALAEQTYVLGDRRGDEWPADPVAVIRAGRLGHRSPTIKPKSLRPEPGPGPGQGQRPSQMVSIDSEPNLTRFDAHAINFSLRDRLSTKKHIQKVRE